MSVKLKCSTIRVESVSYNSDNVEVDTVLSVSEIVDQIGSVALLDEIGEAFCIKYFHIELASEN